MIREVRRLLNNQPEAFTSKTEYTNSENLRFPMSLGGTFSVEIFDLLDMMTRLRNGVLLRRQLFLMDLEQLDSL
jgi:hypothetical protein